MPASDRNPAFAVEFMPRSNLASPLARPLKYPSQRNGRAAQDVWCLLALCVSLAEVGCRPANGVTTVSIHDVDLVAISSAWQLETHAAATAQLVTHASATRWLRVEPNSPTDGPTWQVQLSHGGLAVRSRRPVVIAFRARSSEPRPIGVGLSRAQEPWDNAGFYALAELTREWQVYRFKSTPPRDMAPVRLHFDFGGSNAAVEIADVELSRSAIADVDEFAPPHSIANH